MTEETQETQEELEARFERVRADFEARRSTGQYAWFDFSPSYGWLDLVAELDRKLGQVVPTYKILQVKSKFGGLRYYIEYPEGDDFGYGSVAQRKAEELISEYEELSLKTCERCGKPGGRANRGSWVWTLCSEHKAELEAI